MPATPSTRGATISWGTGSMLGSPSGAIVKSLDITPNRSVPELQDNNSFTDALAILNNGFDAVARCRYDSGKTWPKENETVTLTLAAAYYNDPVTPGKTAFTCLVVGVAPGQITQGAEHDIVLNLLYRPNLSLT